jgi:cytochrome b561
METPKRYHPVLVALHWIMAVLIIFLLLVGNLVMAWMPNDNAKLMPLQFHMLTGILVGVLLIVRFIVRMVTKKPAPATAGNPILDFIGRLTHWGLYLFSLGMVISGMGTSAAANLSVIVFERQGFPAGFDFYAFPPRIGHEFVSYGLFALIALHIGAALYHQFIRKDNLLSRMWFGK